MAKCPSKYNPQTPPARQVPNGCPRLVHPPRHVRGRRATRSRRAWPADGAARSALIESGVGAFYTHRRADDASRPAIIVHAFVTGNYAIKYVQRYSDAAQPLAYKITSYWGGLDGSIMFWVFLLSVFGTIAVATNRERHRELIPWVVAIIAAVEMFFIFIMVVHNNPFSTFVAVDAGRRQGAEPAPPELLHGDPPAVALHRASWR